MKLIIFSIFAFIQIDLVALESEISWSERRDKNLPTSTVFVTINGNKFTFEDSSSGGDGLVSKNGEFIVYSYSSDSNNDGVIDFKDIGKLKILKVNNGNPDLFKVIENVSMFDITSDSKKLMYICVDNNGMSLNKLNLLENSILNVIKDAKWLGHVTISQDDHWCALYVNNENIKNQVIVIGSKGSKVISKDVGNGWGLTWVNNILMYAEDDMKKIKFYDPVRDVFILESDIVNPESFDKRKSGWPKIAKP